MFSPDKAVVTSIDNDHLEAYDHSVKKLELAFISFIQKVKEKVFIHDKQKSLIDNLNTKADIFTYGFDTNSDFQILNFSQNEKGSLFSLKNKIANTLYDFKTNAYGKHNILNLSLIHI